MSSLVQASFVATGQVQSLDSVRTHALPSDALIFASPSLVTPTNQNPGSYIVNDQVSGSTPTINGSVPAVTASPFADLYKEGSVFINGVATNYISTALTGYTMSQGISMEMFVNYQNFTNSTYTIGFMAASAATYNFTLGVNGSGAPIVTWTGSTLVSSVTVSANTWNHLACSWDGTNLRLYVNGALGNSTGIFTPPTLAQNFLVGRTNSLTCTAYVTDVRIVTNPAVYVASTLTVPSAPLSPAAAGTTNFMLRIGQNSPTIQNGALTFDRGLKQFAQFGPQTFNIATRGFTAMFRYTWNGTVGNYERIFDIGVAGASPSYAYNIGFARAGTGNQYYFYVNAPPPASTNPQATTAVGVMNQGTTYVVACRWNPATSLADIWINGNFNCQSSQTPSPALADFTSSWTALGTEISRTYWASASMNTFAIYNRALSNTEIYNSYLALNTVPATPQQKTLEIGDINGTPALSVAGNGQVFMDSVGLTSNVVPWPPAAMTGYDTVINGGVYKARASSEFTSSYAWSLFDKSTSTIWASNGTTGLYSSSAPYAYAGTGAVSTTDVNGTVYSGEWVQIQNPTQTTLSSYSIVSNSANAPQQFPSRWAVLGSRDGVNWTLVDYRAGPVGTNSTTYTYTVTAAQAYTFFRFVILNISGTGGVSYTPCMTEWTLYGTADTSPSLTIAPATTFNTSVATPSLTGIAGSAFVPQDFSSSGLNIPAYVVSNTATTANTVQYSNFGPFAGEGSLYFPGGTGAYVQFPPSTPPASMSPVTPFTAEAWVYFTAYPPTGAAGIFESAQLAMSSVENWGLGVLADGRLSGFIYNTVPTAYNPLLSTVPLNTWSHVALTYDGTSARVFLNGTSSSPTTFSGTPRLLTNSYFWVGVNYVSGFGKPTNAYIASARIVSGQALYTTTFTPPTGPLQPIQGTTQAGQPYGTVLLLRNAPAPGRIQTTRLTGSNSGSVLSFPPAAMTGYATSLNAGYGQGTYVASASSEYTGLLAWNAFDKTTATAWGSSGTTELYNSSGFYAGTAGTVTVDVAGNSYTGAWIQLQLASSMVISSYSMIPSTANPVSQSPSRFWILGSRDGSNWALVDQRTGYSSWVNGQYSTFTVGTGVQAFSFYRIVVNQLAGYVPGAPVVVLTEFVLNGQIEGLNINPDGRLGVGVVNPTRALEVAGAFNVDGNMLASSGTVATRATISSATGGAYSKTVTVTGGTYGGTLEVTISAVGSSGGGWGIYKVIFYGNLNLANFGQSSAYTLIPATTQFATIFAVGTLGNSTAGYYTIPLSGNPPGNWAIWVTVTTNGNTPALITIT